MEDMSRCVIKPRISHKGFMSLAVPTYRASTIVFSDVEDYAKRGERGLDGYSYGLHGTPTTKTLEAQLTSLHRGEATVLLPSGQCAIAVIMLSVLMPGDKVLIPDNSYPPVTGFCKNYLKPRGIDYVIYDPTKTEEVEDLIDAATRLVWLESPGSTTMEVQDFSAIARIAHEKGALVGCDNTWATPLLFKPLEHGADLVMEALTKYIGGHSDLLMGSVTVRDLKLRVDMRNTMRMLGIGIGPDEAALALRGIETLAVRLKHSGRVAEEFARALDEIFPPGSVLHPALSSCPGHQFFMRDFAGASGVFSIVVPAQYEKYVDLGLTGLKFFSIGASWGGTHSLVAPMSVAGNRVKGEAHGGTILRLSVGLEEPADLWSDIEGMVERLGLPRRSSKVA